MPGKPPFLFWYLRIVGPMLLIWLAIVVLDLAFSKVTLAFGIDPYRIAGGLYPAVYLEALAARQNWRGRWRLWLVPWALALGYTALLFATAGGFGLGVLLYGLLGIAVELPALDIAQGIENAAWLREGPHRTAFLTATFLGLPPMGFLAGLLLDQAQRRISPPAPGREKAMLLANAWGLAFALPGLAVFLPLFAAALRPGEQVFFGALVAALAFLPHLALTWRLYEAPAPSKRQPPIVRKMRQSLAVPGLIIVGIVVSNFWH